jgi:hypothetical protein
MLYQLSYQIVCPEKAGANIEVEFSITRGIINLDEIASKPYKQRGSLTS